MPRRADRALYWSLVLVAIAVVTIGLPIFPGHDVPQHLAITKLVAEWQRDPAAYPSAFTPPDLSSSYTNVYRMLALLTRVSGSPERALSIALAAYVVTMALALRWLASLTWSSVCRGEGRSCNTALLAPWLAFHPVLCMGLLPYTFALPPLIGAFAAAVAVVRAERPNLSARVIVLAALVIVTTWLHQFAAAALLVLLGCFACGSLAVRARRSRVFTTLVIASASFGAMMTLSPSPTTSAGDSLSRLWLANIKAYGVVSGSLGTFRVSFTHPAEKLDQIIATVLGPFPRTLKMVVALSALAVVAWTCRLWRKRARSVKSRDAGDSIRTATQIATVLFMTVAVLAPSAVQVPDDLSLIDFRLLATAFLPCVVVMLNPRFFERAEARWPLFAFALGGLLLWGQALRGAASEGMQTVRLVDQLHPSDRLLALPMDDQSDFLDERNAVLHYSAVYHTVHNGGVTSLFWGRFSPRLPIGYSRDNEPRHPFDWTVWTLEDEMLRDYSHVLVRWPEPLSRPGAELGDPRRRLAERIRGLEERGVLHRMGCDGEACLFSIVEAPLAIGARP